jgi:hypothetical protein
LIVAESPSQSKSQSLKQPKVIQDSQKSRQTFQKSSRISQEFPETSWRIPWIP